MNPEYVVESLQHQLHLANISLRSADSINDQLRGDIIRLKAIGDPENVATLKKNVAFVGGLHGVAVRERDEARTLLANAQSANAVCLAERDEAIARVGELQAGQQCLREAIERDSHTMSALAKKCETVTADRDDIIQRIRKLHETCDEHVAVREQIRETLRMIAGPVAGMNTQQLACAAVAEFNAMKDRAEKIWGECNKSLWMAMGHEHRGHTFQGTVGNLKDYLAAMKARADSAEALSRNTEQELQREGGLLAKACEERDFSIRLYEASVRDFERMKSERDDARRRLTAAAEMVHERGVEIDVLQKTIADTTRHSKSLLERRDGEIQQLKRELERAQSYVVDVSKLADIEAAKKLLAGGLGFFGAGHTLVSLAKSASEYIQRLRSERDDFDARMNAANTERQSVDALYRDANKHTAELAKKNVDLQAQLTLERRRMEGHDAFDQQVNSAKAVLEAKVTELNKQVSALAIRANDAEAANQAWLMDAHSKYTQIEQAKKILGCHLLCVRPHPPATLHKFAEAAANEITGLRGDVRRAEQAYEFEKDQADSFAKDKARMDWLEVNPTCWLVGGQAVRVPGIARGEVDYRMAINGH